MYNMRLCTIQVLIEKGTERSHHPISALISSHLERFKRVAVELIKVCVVQKLNEVVLFFHVAEAGRRTWADKIGSRLAARMQYPIGFRLEPTTQIQTPC